MDEKQSSALITLFTLVESNEILTKKEVEKLHKSPDGLYLLMKYHKWFKN